MGEVVREISHCLLALPGTQRSQVRLQLFWSLPVHCAAPLQLWHSHQLASRMSCQGVCIIEMFRMIDDLQKSLR